MKNQILGIFFYLLYLLAMVKPVMPIIEYHANYDYIATVLCENRDRPYLKCNGKCYLEKQLKKTAPTTHDHKSTVPQINLEDYPISPVEQFIYHFLEESDYLYKSKSWFKNYGSQEYYLNLLKPPQVSLS